MRRQVFGFVLGLMLGALFLASPLAQQPWYAVNGVPINAGWTRTGTVLSPTTAGDAIEVDSGGYLWAKGQSSTTGLKLGSTGKAGLYGADQMLVLVASNGARAAMQDSVFLIGSSYTFGWSTNVTGLVPDLHLSREAAAILQLGADVNGSAVAQTLKAHDGITGTDIAGANLILAAGRGTGAGAPGVLYLQTSTAVGSGTTAQTLATRLIVNAAGAVTIGSTDGTGAGAFYAGSYFTGTTAGIDKTCTAAPTALTFNKGILTAATCTDPMPNPTPDPLTQAEVNQLRGLLASLPKQ